MSKNTTAAVGRRTASRIVSQVLLVDMLTRWLRLVPGGLDGLLDDDDDDIMDG